MTGSYRHRAVKSVLQPTAPAFNPGLSDPSFLSKARSQHPAGGARTLSTEVGHVQCSKASSSGESAYSRSTLLAGIALGPARGVALGVVRDPTFASLGEEI